MTKEKYVCVHIGPIYIYIYMYIYIYIKIKQKKTNKPVLSVFSRQEIY
jgi:hypothetical protein